MSMGDLLAAIGVIVAVPATSATWMLIRRARSVGKFDEVRAHVRAEQGLLNFLALNESPDSWRAHAVPMLTRPGWILPRPVLLDHVQLELREPLSNDNLLQSARKRAKHMLPRRPEESRRLSYSEAIVEIGKMSGLFNGLVYRPIAIDAGEGSMNLTFTRGRYFDYLDTGEVLAYEIAQRHLKQVRRVTGGSYRRSLKGPFDLHRRATSLGIITLTVRRSSNERSFYMHQRDGDHVVAGSEIIHVIPAGEFTPSNITVEAVKDDFDIWRNIKREYAEEFLNVEEAYGRSGKWLDNIESPYRELDQARTSGELCIYVLGVAMDPMTWKPELLTVCVIESQVFDHIFANMASVNNEGTILIGNGTGLSFTADTVHLYADNVNTRSAGRACLMLAWQHRSELGLE